MNQSAGLPLFTPNPGGENTGEGKKNEQENETKKNQGTEIQKLHEKEKHLFEKQFIFTLKEKIKSVPWAAPGEFNP